MNASVESFFHADTNTISHVVSDPDTRECALIDSVLDFDTASGSTGTTAADQLMAYVTESGLHVSYILETHVHADHLSAAPYLRTLTGAPVVIGNRIEDVEAAFAPVFPVDLSRGIEPVSSCFDQLVSDGDELPLGNLTIRVLSTPGHTPACSTYVAGDAAFVGDTLFMPDFGTARTDFPGGSAPQLYSSIQRILALPESTRLFMCHDYKAPGRDEFAWETTVAEQRAKNIHIKDGTAEQDFVEFRTERDKKLAVPKLLLPSVQVNLRAGNLPKAAQNGVQYLRIPLNQF